LDPSFVIDHLNELQKIGHYYMVLAIITL